MKNFTQFQYIAIASTALFCSHPSTQAQEVDTTVKVLIKQTQHDDKGAPNGPSAFKWYPAVDILDKNLGDSFQAILPIGPYGSIFELYIEPLDAADDALTETSTSLLPSAVKFVSAHSAPIATAAIQIISRDKSVGYTRTREDEPFAVEISGLANEEWKDRLSKLSEDAKNEIVWDPFNVRVVKSYTATNESNVAIPGTNAKTNPFITYPPEGQIKIATNDTTKTAAFNQKFMSILPEPGRGKITFSIEGAIQKYQGEEIYAEIDSKTIKIWPTAKGKILNEDGEPLRGNRITKSMPNVRFQMWHLYPKSDTFFVIYKLKSSVAKTLSTKTEIEKEAILDNLDNYDKENAKFPTQKGDLFISDYSFVLHHDTDDAQGTEDIPTDKELTIWDRIVPTDGFYSLALYTKTPFEATIKESKLLAKAYIEVDQTVSVKASVITSE